MKRVKVNYVNNRDLFEAMKKFHGEVQLAKQNDTPLPRVPDYIGECLLLIATRLAKKPNFYAYSYRDEMISDGIENCLQYINNFDPEKSQNPFAYFTQIITFAFIRRIEKEKIQQYTKYKNLGRYALVDDIEASEINPVLLNEITNDFIRRFEDNLLKKKKAAKRSRSEKFFEESESDE